MLIFENSGTIDPRLISSFGVNVKESDSAIGYFGTGLKYALAILMREGHEVTIMSGKEVFEIGTTTDTIRGKEFTFVTSNGQALGFTTELGKNWKPWMAYRELRGNAEDEGGRVYKAVFCRGPAPDTTYVVVEGIDYIHDEAHKYFIEPHEKPFIETDNVEVFNTKTDSLFYKGVRVGDTLRPAVYKYNVLQELDLTEDRTLVSTWRFKSAVEETVLKCNDKEFIRKVVTSDRTYESSFSFPDYVEPSETFLDVVERLHETKAARINQSAVRVLKKHRRADMIILKPTEVQLKALNRAIEFCKAIGYNVERYEIVLVESLGDGVLGMALDDKIFLTKGSFRAGTKNLAGTLIEEFIHLHEHVHDCTREMQNILIDSIVSLGEEILGDPL